MKDLPKTKEEAKLERYGCWAGHPKGNPFNEKCCAAHIMTTGRGALPAQCGRSPGHGPEKLYCKTHADEFFPGETATWYKTGSSYDWEIKEVQVCAETDKFIKIVSESSQAESRSTLKVSGYDRYWRTRKQAVAHLLDRAKRGLESAKRSVVDLENRIKTLK